MPIEETKPVEPVVEEGKAVEPEAPSVDPVEEQARSQGWVPKEEWSGDPAAWRPAGVFVDRGELLGKIKSQSGELRELKSMIGYVSEQNRKLYEAGYEKAIADLESQRDAAVEAGEAKVVRELDKQIKSHEKALEDTKQPIPVDRNVAQRAADERFQDFRKNNAWYEKDEVMQDWANGAAVKYRSKINQNATDTDIYEYLSKEVRTKFPEKFKQRVGAPSPDGKSDRGGGSPPSKAGGAEFDQFLNELSEDEAQIARNLVKRGHVTKEEFMKSYNIVGGRR